MSKKVLDLDLEPCKGQVEGLCGFLLILDPWNISVGSENQLVRYGLAPNTTPLAGRLANKAIGYMSAKQGPILRCL